jgi:hypothetical protein
VSRVISMRTDMTKLIVAYRNFVNVSKDGHSLSSLILVILIQRYQHSQFDSVHRIQQTRKLTLPLKSVFPLSKVIKNTLLIRQVF